MKDSKEKDRDYRCPCCGRKLAVGRIIHIRVKCPKCKKLVDIRG